MKEEIGQVVYDGKKIPGYYVSNLGNVYTTIKSKKNSLGQWSGIYFSDEMTLMKPYSVLNKDRTCKCLRINLRMPKELLEYNYQETSNSSCKVKMHVHKMVMDTFKPIIEFPPERLKSFWNDTPHEIKKFISECILINHIDHDPSNNCLENLEYVTPSENTRKAKEFYKGNFSNKSKLANKKEMINEENKISILDFV